MTNIKATLENECSQSDILLGYTMAFGDVPFIEKNEEKYIITDAAHLLRMEMCNKKIEINIPQEPCDCVEYSLAMKRLLEVLGGGVIECSSDCDIAPLKKKEIIKEMEDRNTIFQENLLDFRKFLERPFDDKGFLETIKWNEEFGNIYANVIKSIDTWFYACIPLKQSIKYLIFKYNMENFCCFCITKKGAKTIKEIQNNLKDYHADYLLYLSRYDENVIEAMRKGLKNIQKLEPNMT